MSQNFKRGILEYFKVWKMLASEISVWLVSCCIFFLFWEVNPYLGYLRRLSDICIQYLLFHYKDLECINVNQTYGSLAQLLIIITVDQISLILHTV